jgi:hypothetical protein
MLRQAQHDNKGLFCHSEEQSDEESRVLQSSSYQGVVQFEKFLKALP